MKGASITHNVVRDGHGRVSYDVSHAPSPFDKLASFYQRTELKVENAL